MGHAFLVRLFGPVPRSSIVLVVTLSLAWSTGAQAHLGVEEEQQALALNLAQHPDDPQAYFNVAKGLHTAGKWDEALVAYDEAQEHGADRDECDGGRGQVLLAAGLPRLAKRTFDQVLARRPDAYGMLWDRGRAWLALNEPTKAADDYGRAIAGLTHLTPEHVLAYRDTLLAAQQPTAALRALDEGMARLGAIATLQLAAIEMETSAQHWSGALDRLDQLLRQAPKSEAWIAQRGELLKKLGRADDARAEFQRALDLIAARPADRRPRALDDLAERLRSNLSTTVARTATAVATSHEGKP